MADAPIYQNLNIFQRLNKVMQEVDYIQKEKKAGMRYSIVSHDAVTAKVRPVLVKWGVVYYPLPFEMSQNGNRTQVTMTVRFASIDDGAFIDVGTAGYGLDDQDKGPGKAISYAVKYALLKVLGLESGDDPDEDQQTEHASGDLDAIKKTIDLAEGPADLTNADRDVRALYKKGGCTKVQAQGALAAIQKRLKEFETADA